MAAHGGMVTDGAVVVVVLSTAIMLVLRFRYKGWRG